MQLGSIYLVLKVQTSFAIDYLPDLMQGHLLSEEKINELLERNRIIQDDFLDFKKALKQVASVRFLNKVINYNIRILHNGNFSTESIQDLVKIIDFFKSAEKFFSYYEYL